MEKNSVGTECPRIRVKEVASILGCSVSTVWAWVRAGHVPQPHRVGSRFTFWMREEILTIARAPDCEGSDGEDANIL